MKMFLALSLALFSSLTFAQVVCDLKMNNEASEELSRRFDHGEMRGEDHAIAMRDLYLERLELIAVCIKEDQSEGLTKDELKDLISFIQGRLASFVEEMNEAIQISIENDRIGMATELARERDLEIAETEEFIKKIEKLRLSGASL